MLWGYIPDKPPQKPEKPVRVEAEYEGTGDLPRAEARLTGRWRAWERALRLTGGGRCGVSGTT